MPAPSSMRYCVSLYGSTTTTQVYVPGSRSVLATEPSPVASVEPVTPSQSIVDDVPPSTCELTVIVMSVSGVLLKLTVSPT
jgi:hypothetical protein